MRPEPFFERPATMSSSLAGPVPSRTPVRSMTTVTYRSPWRCLHTCSSTPSTLTPSRRALTSPSAARPASRTALLTVSQPTPRWAATRETAMLSTATAASAQCTARWVRTLRGAAVALMSSLHTPAHALQAISGTRTSRRVRRSAVGVCASSLATVLFLRPCAPQTVHNSRSSSSAITGRASTTSSSRPPACEVIRWPVAVRPRRPRSSSVSGSIESKRTPARARTVAFVMRRGPR